MPALMALARHRCVVHPLCFVLTRQFFPSEPDAEFSTFCPEMDLLGRGSNLPFNQEQTHNVHSWPQWTETRCKIAGCTAGIFFTYIKKMNS